MDSDYQKSFDWNKINNMIKKIVKIKHLISAHFKITIKSYIFTVTDFLIHFDFIGNDQLLGEQWTDSNIILRDELLNLTLC